MNVTFIAMTRYFVKKVPEHIHNQWEVLYYLHGNGTLYVEGNAYDFEEGDIIFQPPNCNHYELSQNGFINIYVQVPHLDGFEQNIYQFKNYPNKELIREIFVQMHNTFNKKQHNWSLLVNSFFDVIYQNIISSLGISYKNKYVERIENCILENITNSHFNVQHEIDELPLSSDHFRTMFKAQTGTTPLQYLIKKRIAYAIRLMETKPTSIMNIKQIAYNVGFEDEYYFSRTFKKITGKSPLHYCQR